ncbi:hypothetical protein M9Y10_012546 [Tritrichomonas musculus]|uniref:Protein kinase domain-containing protein n=1 Tax=Tritrichomonas musculus TaxID=1915356 RepID=A0ABR2IDW7_9EUKA
MGNEESKQRRSSNAGSSNNFNEEDIPVLDLDESVGDANVDEDSDDYDELFKDTEMYNIEGYKYVKKLGSGASGVVLLMNKGDQEYAVKVCNIQKANLNFLKPSSHDPKEEAVIMKRLNNANIVKVYDFIEDIDNNLIYIVMEYLPGGTIESCKTLEANRQAFKQVLSGLQYLHNQRLAHRDIKVENVMLDAEGNAKLCDFGISVYVPLGQNKILTEMKGTPAYCAPELFQNTEYDPFKADIWAFGITLYILAFHDLPFKAEDLFKMQNAIMKDEPKFPEGADPNLKDLISKMLEKDPDNRITIEGIWSHPWANGLRPAFSGLFMACSNVMLQVGNASTEGVIKKIRRGKNEKIKKKKSKKLNLLIHGNIEKLKEKRHHLKEKKK